MTRRPTAVQRRQRPLTASLFDRVTELLEVGLTPRSEVRYLLRLRARLLRRLER